MPEFHPFRGIRFDTSSRRIGDLTAPPYDVINAAERDRLLARDPHNIVRIDLPVESDGLDRYTDAARLLEKWMSEGALVRDSTPAFYAYRMDYTDDAGRPAHTLGVLGALRLSRPGNGSILPHEYTTPKAKSDRLDLLRATRMNLSAIWGLSLAEGLTDLCQTNDEPDEAWDDEDGVTHSLWVLTDPEICGRISEAVGTFPIVVADGHHRYETSLTYLDERQAAADNAEGAEFAMFYVVELTDSELTVRPIHRLLTGVDPTTLAEQLGDFFTSADAGPVDTSITQRMAETGALTLVAPDGQGTFLLPIAGVFDGADDLDSSRLALALESLGGAEVSYQHGIDYVLEALRSGDADAGVLLRPASVAQIEDNAHAGRRMPPKTTFFHPKPRTGQVFRPTD